MITYTDDDGNEVEIDATPAQIKEWQEKAAKLPDLEKSVADKDAELAKLAQKEMNFSKFREKTKEEQEAFRTKLTEENKMIFDEVIALREENHQVRKSTMESAEARLLTELAGKDDKLKESIKAQAKDFAGEAKTPEELERRYRNSFAIIKGQRPSVRPIFEYTPSTSGDDDPDATPKDYVKTPKGIATFEALFGHKPGELNKKK